MEFRSVEELDDDVLVERDGDLAIAIPPESIELLRGAMLALQRRHGDAEPQPAAPARRAASPTARRPTCRVRSRSG